jgi:hypothetical protein
MQWAGHVAHTEWDEQFIQNLAGKSKGRRTHKRPKHTWTYNIKMKLIKETGWERMNWIHLPQDRDQCWTHVNMIITISKRQRI